jgi:isopentenyl diphosphate isomerase/L-lactate dehydrogenase-like FMN-dependent dehydrogenase
MDTFEPLNLQDFERAAAERLPRFALDYFASGSDDEIALRRNRAAFERITLRYRALRGVGAPDTSVTLLGRRHALPVVIAPTAFMRLADEAGELAVARAAASAGVTQGLSTLSTYSLEEVASAASGPKWFQVYVFKDRALTASLVRRAETAGYEALVVTVDAPVLGTREADVRNRFSLPAGMFPANLAPEADRAVRASGDGSGLQQYFTANIDPTLTWADIDWLRSLTPLPVLVKGIVRGDDAAEAVAHGVAGIIVSNHGGRQLDSAPAGIDAVSEVASAVGGHVPVLMDGGVRRGSDVVKAIARGADAVLIGRPVLWALAAGGEAGVARMLALLRAEIEQAMALCGCRTLAEVGTDLLGTQ